MAEKISKPDPVAYSGSAVTGGTPPSSFSRLRKFIWISLGIVILAGAITGGILVERSHAAKNRASQAAINAAQLKTLQAELAAALSAQSDQSIINDTNLIISGYRAGRFHLSNSALAQNYLEAGASNLNLKQYAPAMADFQQADKLDPSSQNAALQGEVSAGYALGKRQQLIPLLQQLETLAKQNQSMDPLDTTPAQYQADINAIEHNQPAEL